MKIRDVRTVYTGGGIFEYIVELDGGTWAMFDDEDLSSAFVPVVDTEPTDDDWHSEFFEEHDAGYLINDEAVEFMCKVLLRADLTDWERGERMMILYKGEE